MATCFSYAAAAKGLAPAVQPVQSENSSEAKVESSSADLKSSSSEAKLASEKASIATPSGEEAPVKTDDAPTTALPVADAGNSGIDVINSTASGPTCTEFGTDSTATLLKDDEPNGTTHDGSESTTWEKVSQSSQSPEKANKGEENPSDSKTDEWEHVPPPQLKDAPPPAVNPWLKRAQDLQIKSSPATLPNGPQAKAPSDSAHTGGRKKQRPSVSSANGVRPDKASMGKNKNDEAPLRRYRPASEAKALARMPPPASDSFSWPTPDLAAKPEDKQRPSPEKTETTESDKPGSAKHGKNQWVSVPFVPTAVFNTPLPMGRRGGRATGRGGKEGGVSRGAANGTPTERPDRSPSAQRGDVSVDGSRIDVSVSRHSVTARQKRLSQTGQSRPQELPNGDDVRERRQSRVLDQEASTTQDTSRDVRRSFRNSDFGDHSKHASSGAKAPNVGAVVNEYSPPVGDAPTKIPERRGGPGFGAHRDGNDLRESRSERGGRTYRGRGGHGMNSGYSGPHVNGMGSYGPGYSPIKAGYDQRSASHPGYNVTRDSRHARGGSRTQPNQTPRYGAGYAMNPNLPVGMPFSPIAPEMTAGYGFVPGVTPPFFQPYQDQQGLVGMIMEQMRYWFSFENLIRDLYLRKRMDDNGFVPLAFLMPWKRMQVLTSDVKMVRFACQNVPQLDLRVDPEGNEYVRKATDWEKWVLPKEERHVDAQDTSRLQLFAVFPQSDHSQHHQSFAPQQRYPQKHTPAKAASDVVQQQVVPIVDDTTNGSGASGNQTPLSATVPEFKPEGLLATKAAHAVVDDNVPEVQSVPTE